MTKPRRKQKQPEFFHGQQRQSDNASTTILTGRSRSHLHAPAGTSVLLFLLVAAAMALGLSRVRISTQLLEAGSDVAELSSTQARLLEDKRRFSAERAYLRHPRQVASIARDELGMVPIAPELVQKIRVRSKAGAR